MRDNRNVDNFNAESNNNYLKITTYKFMIRSYLIDIVFYFFFKNTRLSNILLHQLINNI